MVPPTAISKSPVEYNIGYSKKQISNECTVEDTMSGDRGNAQVAVESGKVGSGGGSKKQKNIPLELTAYGTTPSGKPRLFVCQICTRAFARLEHLRRHERSHTKEKPFSCGVCQRKFSRRDLLLRHAQKLHAGCADAITRLRRKSIKRNSYPSLNEGDEDTNSIEESEDRMTEEDVKKFKGQDSIEFNLNLFDSTGMRSPIKGSPTKEARSSILKDSVSSLHRHVFDKKKAYRNRGASFSAQSGANYSVGLSEFNDIYPGTDNIEFSTPQLLPSSTNQEQNWLNNLSSIPGMNGNDEGSGKSFGLKSKSASIRDSTISSKMDSFEESKSDAISHGGSFSHGGMNHLRSDSLVSTSSFNTFESIPNPPYMVPNSGVSDSDLHGAKGDVPNNDYGYSFYDIPEGMMNKASSGSYNIPYSLLSSIKREQEDEMLQDDKGAFQENQQDFNMNFLDDIDELTHEFDVGSKFLPSGYSFYGDNPSVSSSGVETNSPSIISPPSVSNHQSNASLMNDHTINQTQLLKIENDFNKMNSIKAKNYSKSKLFTNNMRYIINKSLNKYPISGIMTPSIPSNEKLENYLSTFVDIFLAHFPFIHVSKLNEYEIMKMTSNEDASNGSARVCLPLLIATIGALLANNKNDSEHLYEASRRTIHIYLESRKNSSDSGNNASQTINPLWLIQSLTLSVIYGLFSDNENNIYIVIRQLNALNSLVKTSIKSNRSILFSINGEDDSGFNCFNNSNNDSLFTNFNMNDEIKFRNSINTQSQSRIVFMIYRLTNFLLMMYNVPLTLSVNDIGSLLLPSQNDEYIWDFKDYQSFKTGAQTVRSGKSIDDYLINDEKTSFKNMLVVLTTSSSKSKITGSLSSLSRFSLLSLVHGTFEIQQYQEMKSMNLFSVLELLVDFSNSTSNVSSRTSRLETQDILMIVTFFKLSLLIDFKLVKEQSWLKNSDELTKNFSNFLTNSVDRISDMDFLKIVDCCTTIIKQILFNTVDLNLGKDKVASEREIQPESSLFENVTDVFKHISPGDTRGLKSSPMDLNERNRDFDSHTLQADADFIGSKNSLYSQMLFHSFTVLSIFSIHMRRKSNKEQMQSSREQQKVNVELESRFKEIVALLNKIESFLKEKCSVNSSFILENDFTNLYLYSFSTNHCSLENALYTLKIGELVLSFMYESTMKVAIFKKLAGSLSQIRKFLIDNESKITQT